MCGGYASHLLPAGRDTNKIADEVVQHFNALTDAEVESYA
jgi:hypothetical protein